MIITIVFARIYNMRKYLYLLLTLPFAGNLSAEIMREDASLKTFTIDDYIVEYLKNSPALASEFNLLKTAELSYKNSLMSKFLPSFGAGANTVLLSDSGPGGLRFDNEYTAGVFADWNLFNSGRDYLGWRQDRNNLEISRVRFKNILQDTVLDAINSFYDFKLGLSLLDVAQKDYDDKKEEFEKVSAMYREGLRSYYETLQAENNFKSSELRLEEAITEDKQMRIKFNLSLNRDPNALFDVRYELPPAEPFKDNGWDADLKTAVDNREDIVTAILRLQNSKIDKKLVTMNNLPMVTAGFSAGRDAEDVFGGERDYRTNYTLGLNLSVPIGFFWADKYNEIKISKYDLVNSYMGFETLYRNLQDTLSRVRSQLALQFKGIEISEINLRVAGERLEILRARYNDGNVDYLTVSIAQDDFLSAQIADTNFKYNYQRARYAFLRALGLDIYDVSNIDFDGSFEENKIAEINRVFLKK